MKSTRFKKVAIIGRPNVGKSTLFNRLVQQRISITSDISGTTRDRITFPVEWLNRTFNLIDTGGFTNRLNEDNFQKLINIQVEFAIKEADLIIFLISKEGITSEELQISKKLKQSKKPIILAVNKIDNIEQKNNLEYFYKLGIEKQIPISSIHGIGISTLLDEVINDLDLLPNYNDYSIKNRIGIIGKPNVGKSTLINSLLKDQRVIVSDIPGTTRDSIDTKITYHNKEYIFTDTAGLKKNKKALDDIEFYSELRTNFAISNSEIVVLMIDPIQGINKIDEQILQILKEQYKPTIIAINKIDSINDLDLKEFKINLLEEFKFFNDPYIIEISSLNSKNLTKIFDAINRIQISLERKISISEINNFLIDIQTIKKVPRHNGINIRLTYITYSNNSFPHFIIFSNYPQYVHFSYERFIINNLKKIYDFKGIPIKITFKKNI